MDVLHEVSHLTLAEMERAFEVLEQPQKGEELPPVLRELNMSQWETLVMLLSHLRMQQAESQIH